jgi:hypothetical protein
LPKLDQRVIGTRSGTPEGTRWLASGQRYVQWLKSKRCWRFRRRVPGHHDYALAGEDDLSRSIRRFPAGPRVWQYPQWLRPETTEAKVEALLADPNRLAQLLGNADTMTQLKRQCRVLHHEWVGGFLGEIDERELAVSQIMSAIHAQDADPLQIAGAIAGRPIATATAPAPIATPPQQSTLSPCSFKDLVFRRNHKIHQKGL